MLVVLAVPALPLIVASEAKVSNVGYVRSHFNRYLPVKGRYLVHNGCTRAMVKVDHATCQAIIEGKADNGTLRASIQPGGFLVASGASEFEELYRQFASR